MVGISPSIIALAVTQTCIFRVFARHIAALHLPPGNNGIHYTRKVLIKLILNNLQSHSIQLLHVIPLNNSPTPFRNLKAATKR